MMSFTSAFSRSTFVSLGLGVVLALGAFGCAQSGAEPESELGVARSELSASVRRARATTIRDAARADGITNGLVVAMLAEEETFLNHCHSEAPTWSCPGPASPDCGGGAVISGGGDGPCSIDQGGLSLFQIDDGTESQTVAAHGARVLTIEGSAHVAINRLIDKLIVSSYLGISTRAEAITFLNNLRIDDANWNNYISTLVRYWNGCSPSNRCWGNRFPKYNAAARTLLGEMGRDFWYSGSDPMMMPPPASGTYTITQSGSEIPRQGLRNGTLEASLGVAVEPYGTVTMTTDGSWVRGTVSHFGGANDTGVTATETGSISGERLRSLNVPATPTPAQIAANPGSFYFVAMRWNYSPNGRTWWRNARIALRNATTGRTVIVRPVDWGPHTRTARIVDISPQAMTDLGVSTDASILVAFAPPGTPLGVVGAAPTPTPMPGEGWLRNPTNVTRVTSYVTHTSSGNLVRYDCGGITRSGHRGTDFGVPTGTPVFAAAAGTVLRVNDGCPAIGNMSSSCGGGYGNHVIILHEGGFATLYAHFTPGSVIPRTGSMVACGEQIGLSGTSGRSSGPHLHFEVRSNVTNVSTFFVSNNTLDPYGGRCSSQENSLWTGGAPMASCEVMGDNSQLTAATYGRPVSGVAGTTIRQRLSFRNTGTTTWNPMFRLVHTGGEFTEVMPLPVDDTVAPGGNYVFEIVVETPSAPGTHRGEWRIANAEGTTFGQVGSLTINIAEAPRGCNSHTLGRTVDHGSCVQVTYSGCGRSTCAWFRCADTAWLCTQPSDCEGESFANARCGGGDAGPARDVGPVDAMMCTNPLQTSCSSDTQCCDATCAPRNGTLQCCLGAAQRCTSSMDCCGQTLCIAGRCALTARGGNCERTAECAGGGICRRPSRGAICALGQRDCTCQ
jgi:murein DD-endopeptidase MepM/ murein hydrolase activator NlpD